MIRAHGLHAAVTVLGVRAPIVRGRKGEYERLLDDLARRACSGEDTMTFSQHLGLSHMRLSFDELMPRDSGAAARAHAVGR